VVKRAARPARLGMGELESQVMDVLWDAEGSLTPAEVNEQLATGRDLAYTTVMTILVRLFEKGEVSREHPGRGRVWAYRPVLDREEHAAERMSALLRAGGDRSVALARFVDSMSAKERAQLGRVLDARKRVR
jgi:predicted transcriptional regulator